MLANDDVFDALANYQRRLLLVHLLNYDSQRVPELSDEARNLLEADESLLGEFLSTSQETANVDKARLRLYCVHLPTLAEYGFIEWDRESRIITKGPHFEDVKSLLTLMDDRRDETLAKGTAVPLRG